MNTVNWHTENKRWWINSHSAFSDWEKDPTLYTSLSNDEKQDYWNCFVFTMVWYDERGTELPIDIASIRTAYGSVEDNIDRFLPWTMLSLMEEWFVDKNWWPSYNYEDIFILDETAKHYLRVHSLTASNSQAVWWIISQTEQQFSELAEKIGDLFYDGLADVFEGLSQTITPTASIQIIKAKQHASTAWEICKPYISEKTNPKHKTNVAGMDNKTLWNRIGKLDNNTLKSLLELLWNKIHIDGLADQGRWRKKLATELFSCSESLLNASKEL